MLKEPVVSTGRFYYEKPDKLRWEFISPDPSGFLVNGKLAKQWKGKNNPPEAFDLQQNQVIRAYRRSDFWHGQKLILHG